MRKRSKGLLDRLQRAAPEPTPSTDEPPAPVVNQPQRRGVRPTEHHELTVFIVAGEHSGDVLGAALMNELMTRRRGQVRFIGVGGEAMEAKGLTSLFPLSDIAVMGPVAILQALPRITNRVYRTVAAGIAAKPDVIVIIDSPEFTHQVAKRLRRKLPRIPIIDYVCPSVWAWRPGRAKKMARYIDHVLTLLPFEPAALARLNGPPGTYVGHPLSERQAWIQSLDPTDWSLRLNLSPQRIPIVVLPGSRRSEIEKLMPVFGEALEQLHQSGKQCQLLIPCVPHLRERIVELSQDWSFPRHYIAGQEEKFAAFRVARAALAASGTVTLELGVSGTPMIVAYRVDGVAAKLRFLLKVDSVVLANLVLAENAFPEFLQEDCTPEKLCAALVTILDDTSQRRAQLAALERLAEKMKPIEPSTSARAADVVLQYALK